MMKCKFAMMKGRGQLGTTTPHMPGYWMKNKQKVSFLRGKRKKKWTGWKTKTDEQKIEFRKKVMEIGEDMIGEGVATIQRTFEIASHQRRKGKIIQSTPENVRLHEEAVARCTKKDQEESAQKTGQESEG